jgi:hypothetical protein
LVHIRVRVVISVIVSNVMQSLWKMCVSVQRAFSSEALNAYLLVFYESRKPIPIMWSILHCLFWGWSPPRWGRPPELLECNGVECLQMCDMHNSGYFHNKHRTKIIAPLLLMGSKTGISSVRHECSHDIQAI